MTYNFQSREQFETRVIEMAMGQLFNGRLLDAATQVVDFAMSLGIEDAKRFDKDKLCPKLMTTPESRFHFVYNGEEIDITDRLTSEKFARMSFEDHKEDMRREMTAAILEGRLFAKAVIVAAYRIALITCAQITVARLGDTVFN